MLENLSHPVSLPRINLPQRLSGRFFLFALLAGLCWIGNAALQVGQQFGTEGPPFHQNTLGLLLGDRSVLSHWLSMPLHFGANVATGLALIAFADRLPAYRESRQRAGVGFACFGVLAGVADLALLLPERILTNYATLYSLALFVRQSGGLPLSIAALLIGFGAWHVHNPKERRAARCIALFGLLTLSPTQLLYVLAFIPGVGALLYGPVMLLMLPEMALMYVRPFLSGPLWLAAALFMALGDKPSASSTQTAARTGA